MTIKKRNSGLSVLSITIALALLSFLSEENVEDSLKNVRRSRAMVALNSIHKQSLSNGGDKITHTEIDQEIKAVRKRRAK